MSETLDRHIKQRYHILKRVGKGAYGIVFRAKSRKADKEEVALKKIFDAFANATDGQRTFREVMFLQEFKNHENIIRLHEILPADNELDLYLVFDFMPSDLHKVIRLNILKDIHKKSITHQILKAVKFIHSAGVIHRDLKPSNVLLDKSCQVKVCDFGLARSVLQLEDDETNPALTDYVATRWYRAPEILLGAKAYTKGVDTWSIGCIIAELYLRGTALFPGTDTFNQIERIVACLPPPTEKDIDSLDSQYATKILIRQRSRNHIPLGTRLASATDDSLDLMEEFLRWNPTERLTAADALEHHYVQEFHDADTEPSMPYDIVPPVKEDIVLTAAEYRERLYESMRNRDARLCVTQRPHPPPAEAPGATTPPSNESSSRSASQSATPRAAELSSPQHSARSRTMATSSEDDNTYRPKATAPNPTKSHAAHASQTSLSSHTGPAVAGYRPGRVTSVAVAALAAARRNLLERHGFPTTQAITRGAGRYQPAAYTQSYVIPKQNPSQAWIDAKATAETDFDAPEKEAPVQRISTDDFMKSVSAPDLVTRHSPSNNQRQSALVGSGMRRAPRPSSSTRPQERSRDISFSSSTKELHSTLVPGHQLPEPVVPAQPALKPSRIPRTMTMALDARRTSITRGDYADSRIGAPTQDPAGLLTSARMVPSSRAPSTVDAARRSAARKASATVLQQATQSRRRQYTADSQFSRPPVGRYTSSHGVISQSTLTALKGRK